MQPFPSLPLLRSPVAWAILLGVVLTGPYSSLQQARGVLLSFHGHTLVTSSDDDRGSGRLANRAEHQNHLSFRGSGRIHPEPQPPAHVGSDSTAPYRGSGRLG